MKRHKKKIAVLLGSVLLLCWLTNSCVRMAEGIPEGIKPVSNFKKDQYLGKWYEIARLDHKFERGLSEVSAEYSIRDDGGIKVLNRGFSKEKGEWKEAEGKAYFVSDETTGHLKVSFFGPFYGSYVVFELDSEDYGYAYITSYKKDFLWFLSRKPIITKDQKQQFIDRVVKDGFNAEGLIFVEHSEVK